VAVAPGVSVGIIGTGFLAETRARAYRAVSGHDVRLVAAASRTRERAEAYASRHGIPDAYADYRQILDRADVQVVDLCVPNHLHRPIAEEAAAAGKHVICTKPLTAVGTPGNPAAMLRSALENADAMVTAAERAGVRLMYGENWVYAPSIQKAGRLAATSGGAILEMRGGECHSGSHSPYSKEWRTSGGGALLRLGAHPIGAMLHLKREEGLRRSGVPIRPKAVIAETGDLTRTPGFDTQSAPWLASGWVDVENWAGAIVTFEDDTRGVVFASDAVLGGMESSLDLHLSNASIKCRLSHTNLVTAYAPDPSVFEPEYLMEKLETRAGWTMPAPDEDWANGHLAMIQDFVASVAEGRPAQSEGSLGRDVVAVVYAAYLAASEGRRVTLAT
jgi:predicted dehydrogenase